LSPKTVQNIYYIDFSSYLKQLLLLMKPRVMSLVLFTCLVGIVIAPSQIDFFKSAIGLFFVAVGAGASGILNMWYDADIDKVMSRTCLRPLPTGRFKKKDALFAGVFLSFLSVISLYYFTNILSAFLLAFTIFFYFFIYSISDNDSVFGVLTSLTVKSSESMSESSLLMSIFL